MAFKRKFRRSFRRRTNPKRRTLSRTRSRKGTLKTIIRREIARNIENKMKDYEIPSVDITNTIDNGTLRYIIPTITQGTTQSNRIGNKIRVKRVTLRLAINMLNLGAGLPPTYIDIYIFKPKFMSYWAGALPAVDMTEFLQNDSSAEPYNGEVLDGLRYINDDLFTLCYKKRLTMFNAISNQTTASTTSTINPCRTLFLDITKHVKKNLLFEDGVSTPTNDNLILAMGSTQTDGSTYFGVLARYQGIVQMIYEDA